MTMETVTSRDGTAIAYWRSGHGPPLLLVHGGLSDRTAWVLVQPALAERFTVYAINRRGRDGSGEPAAHAMEREFEDVVAVIDAIGEPVHLLGHSGGALCSLGAVLLTDHVRSLILYEPPSLDAVGAELNVSRVRKLVEAGKNEEAAIEFLRTGPGVSEEDLDRFRRSQLWSHIVSLAPTMPPEFDALMEFEFEVKRYGALKFPLLLLVGSESPPRLRELSDALARIVPDARVVELEGQQHGANLTAPDLFVAEVTKFLDEVQEALPDG